MKKIAFIVIALISIMPLVFSAYAQIEDGEADYIEMGGIARLPVIDADEIPYGSKPINKLDRGIVNSATFWLEIPAEVAKVSKEQNPLMGATVGVVHGLVTSVVRAGSAAFDTVTFFVPPYDKPVMKPEYALNRADDKMTELFW
jgi:putative exosortase-associated protein (TIGR04073 family)